MSNIISSALTTKQKMLKILKDTAEHYAEDPDNRRSIDKDGNCNYTWGDTHCAIGRYLKPEYQRENWIENNMSVNELCQNTDDGEWNIDWCLRDDVHGLNADFWKNLQDFHDSHSCWITKEDYNKDNEPIGLSLIGKNNYRVIEKVINRDGYDG